MPNQYFVISWHFAHELRENLARKRGILRRTCLLAIETWPLYSNKVNTYNGIKLGFEKASSEILRISGFYRSFSGMRLRYGCSLLFTDYLRTWLYSFNHSKQLIFVNNSDRYHHCSIYVIIHFDDTLYMSITKVIRFKKANKITEDNDVVH